MGAGQPTSATLAEVRALREGGASLRLGDLWQEQPALLLFLRHFGCIGCVEQIGELRPRLGELLALGVRVVLVGCGAASELDELRRREELGADVLLVTDPTLGAHGAAGMLLSWWGSWGPLAIAGFVRAWGRGYQQPGGLLIGRPEEGERAQQGGALLIDRGGEVLFAYTSARLGDTAPLGEVLDACLRLLAGRARVRV